MSVLAHVEREENYPKPRVIEPGNPAEIRTGYFPDTIVERFHYNILLSGTEKNQGNALDSLQAEIVTQKDGVFAVEFQNCRTVLFWGQTGRSLIQGRI
jgi:hypothetical protein